MVRLVIIFSFIYSRFMFPQLLVCAPANSSTTSVTPANQHATLLTMFEGEAANED